MSSETRLSTRPRTHAERARCVEFAGKLVPAELNPTVATSLAEFGSADAAYEAARIANAAAATRVVGDRERVHAASAVFRKGFLKWTVAIDDAHDKGYALAALKPELGGLPPSSFLEETGWEKVARMITVFASVDADPDLVGRPEIYEALRRATDELRDALGALDQSVGARAEAVQALGLATRRFDRAWGKLVHDLVYYDPIGLGAGVPRFQRAKRSADAAAPAPAAEPAPTAEPEARAMESAAPHPVGPGALPDPPTRDPEPEPGPRSGAGTVLPCAAPSATGSRGPADPTSPGASPPSCSAT